MPLLTVMALSSDTWTVDYGALRSSISVPSAIASSCSFHHAAEILQRPGKESSSERKQGLEHVDVDEYLRSSHGVASIDARRGQL